MKSSRDESLCKKIRISILRYVCHARQMKPRPRFSLERRLQWSNDIFFFVAPYCRVNPIKRHERAATHDERPRRGTREDEWRTRVPRARERRAETRSFRAARFISNTDNKRIPVIGRGRTFPRGRPARKQTRPEFSLL